jgi:hypothetical protein
MGSDLTGATGLNGLGSGISVHNFTVVNDTEVTANLSITANAALTSRSVIVATPDGNTNPISFTVVAPGTPTLTQVSPSNGTHGTNVSVTLTGTNFTTTGTSVAVSGGVNVSGVTVVNSTTITVTFHLPGSNSTGSKTVTVTTPGGVATGSFTVN